MSIVKQEGGKGSVREYRLIEEVFEISTNTE